MFSLSGFSVTGTSFIHTVSALESTEFIQQNADYQFGEEIIFSAQVRSEDVIQNATVSFQESNGKYTGMSPVDITPLGNGDYLLISAIEIQGFPLRPFTTIQYRFDTELTNGVTLQSPIFSFRYLDNRFQWQQISRNQLVVNWYGSETSFGEAAMTVAVDGLEQIRSNFSLDLQDRVEIYIYQRYEDFDAIIPVDRGEKSVGFAEPDLNHIVVYIPADPGYELTLKKRIPHELMHILVEKKYPGSPQNLPVWLNEGLASIAELYPDPDYAVILEEAVSMDQLIPLQTLCDAFPQDHSQDFLAYAQASSFIRFLLQRYKSEAIIHLLEVYSSGAGCEDGIETALGVPLFQLESQWRSSLSEAKQGFTLKAGASPLYVLLGSILIAPVLAILFAIIRKLSRQSGSQNE